MDEVNYGLSEKGFKRKRLPEIIQSLNDRVSDKLGIQISTDAGSVFGQLHGVYAYELADLWALAEDCYNAMYPSTATGDSLSQAAGLAGIIPIQAEKTTLIATCYGQEGAEIPYGTQISDGTNTFSCTDVYKTISAERVCYIAVRIDGEPVTGTIYKLSIDGTSHSHTAIQGESATNILIDLYSQFSFSDRTGTTNNDVLAIYMNDESDTMTVSVENLVIQQIGSPFNFSADKAGAINPNIGKVNQIPLAYTGWESVENNVPAVVGREAETDIELRQRWNSSVYSRAQAMTEAIQAAIYQNVAGVTVCLVDENDTDSTDSEGRPPHSIECVVAGGSKTDIAKQIWERKPAGITTYGSVSQEITDSQGISHIINFNRPEEVKVWLKVVIMENPEQGLPTSAVHDIEKALIQKGAELQVGEDVILQKFFAAIFSATTGIGYISLTAASGETAFSYSTDNIEISVRQVAVFDADRIDISIQE